MEYVFDYRGSEFEWTVLKAARNAAKHGVRFEEAVTTFFDPGAVVIADEEHSEYEGRFQLLGLSTKGRILSVAHVEHGERFRIINARVATKGEGADYDRTGRTGL